MPIENARLSYGGGVEAPLVDQGGREHDERGYRNAPFASSLHGALAAAVAAGGGIISVHEPGTYALPETLRLEPGITLTTSTGVSLAPAGDFPVIEYVAESRIRDVLVDVRGVSGYSAAAVRVDGSTNIRGLKRQSAIKGLEIVGDYEGTGIFFDCEAGGIIGLARFEDIHIRFMHTGMKFRSLPDTSVAWLNGCVFDGGMLIGCIRMIDMDTLPGSACNAHTFVGYEIQPTRVSGTPICEYILRCNGNSNSFLGFVTWDAANVINPADGVQFGPTARANYLQAPLLRAQYITDLGDNIVVGSMNNPVPSRVAALEGSANVPGWAGRQDDFLAYAHKQYEVSQVSGPSPGAGSLANLFDPVNVTSSVSWTATAADPVVLEIDFGSALLDVHALRVLHRIVNPADAVRIEVDTDGAGSWTEVANVTDNETLHTIALLSAAGSPPAHRVRITLSRESGAFVIESIRGLRRGRAGSAWFPRGGGRVYGTVDADNLQINGVSLPQPISMSTTWDPGTIPAGGNVTATFAMPGGTAVTDYSGRLSSLTPSGMRHILFDVRHSTMDEVRVTLHNLSDSDLSPGSGTLYVWGRQ